MKKQNHLHIGWLECELIFSKLHFWEVNYCFKWNKPVSGKSNQRLTGNDVLQHRKWEFKKKILFMILKKWIYTLSEWFIVAEAHAAQ